MATWDDSKSSEYDFEEEKANMVSMACTKSPTEMIQSESKFESNSEEVFSELSCYDLEYSLSKVMEKYLSLLDK